MGRLSRNSLEGSTRAVHRLPCMKNERKPTGDSSALPADAALLSKIETLEKEMKTLVMESEALRAEADKFKDLAARAQADLQNAKGRIERERGELAAFALEGVLRKLLPTVDSFQRAFQHLPEDLKNNEWVRGVQAIELAFLRELEGMGLTRMSSMGAAVDPARHEVLQEGPGAANTVTEVFEEGYEFHGKVLRPAKVKAGNTP